MKMLLFHCTISLLQRDYNWGTGANNHRFAFLITDELIDMDHTKDALPTKEVHWKPFKMLVSLWAVVGETREKKDFDPLVNGTNGLYLDIDKNFADLLNVQFANKVVETVQKVVSSRYKQTSMSWSQNPPCGESKTTNILASNACNHSTPQNRLEHLQNRPYLHLLKRACQNGSLYRTSSSSSKESKSYNTGSKTSIALTTLGLGLLSMVLPLDSLVKQRKTNLKRLIIWLGLFILLRMIPVCHFH